MPPKTERGNSESNKFAPKLPRSVFRLAAGVAPDPLREGQYRARSTGDTGACLASRGLRLFSRQLGLYEDAAGTLRAGRENRSPVPWGRVGTLQARGGTTGAARSVFGARRVDRVIRVFNVDRVKTGDRGKTANPSTAAKQEPTAAEKRRPRQNGN